MAHILDLIGDSSVDCNRIPPLIVSNKGYQNTTKKKGNDIKLFTLIAVYIKVTQHSLDKPLVSGCNIQTGIVNKN